MTRSRPYPVQRGWRVLLGDLGIRAADVLRRAGLPEDLLSRADAGLTTEEYFRFWRALEEEAADPLLPIRIGETISVEAFDPPVFAAMCSRDLNVALRRLASFKRLMAQVVMHVDVQTDRTRLDLDWTATPEKPPAFLVVTELVFFVQLARLATRVRVRPLRVTTTQPLSPYGPFADFFGVPVRRGAGHSVVFSALDASRPFLTANEGMWEFFEPELRRRLSELDEAATVSDRVRAALLVLLPGGDVSLTAVSRKLSVSARSLQRHLGAEGTRFQSVLSATREELARHYLRTTSMSAAEISFLLGFDDPNSFFRAFHAWTGETPERVRAAGG